MPVYCPSMFILRTGVFFCQSALTKDIQENRWSETKWDLVVSWSNREHTPNLLCRQLGKEDEKEENVLQSFGFYWSIQSRFTEVRAHYEVVHSRSGTVLQLVVSVIFVQEVGKWKMSGDVIVKKVTITLKNWSSVIL